MTATRSYKKPLSAAQARAELTRNAGTQFDPAVVRAFLAVGLGRTRAVLGPLAWLNELPRLSQVPAAASTSVGTMATAAITATAVSVGSVLAIGGTTDNSTADAVERVVEAASRAADRSSRRTGRDRCHGHPADHPTIVLTEHSRHPDRPGRLLVGTASHTTTMTVTPITTAPATTAPARTAPATTAATTIPSRAPTVLGDAYTVAVDTKKKLFVLDNDNAPDAEFDVDTLQITVPPSQVDNCRVHNDHIHYDKPVVGATTDSFTYSICDNDGDCASATVQITIVP